MKSIIIKKFSLVLFTIILGIGNLHAQHGGVPAIAKGEKPKKLELKKNKSGHYDVNWDFFKDYDSKKKKVGPDLNKLIGKTISIKGFMIPLDYTAKKIKEFLIVPYMPSCMHVPPPPENMIINAKMNKGGGIAPSYYPVEVVGKLGLSNAKKSEDPFLPNGLFSLSAISVKEIKN